MKKLLLFALLFALIGCTGLQKQDMDKKLIEDLGAAEQAATKWSDYGDMGAATVNDVDTFLIRDVSDVSLAATGTQKEFPWSVLKTDLTTWMNGAAFTSVTGARATTGLLSGGVVTKSTAASYTIGTTNTAECYGGVIYATGAGIDITACDNLAAGMAFTVIVVGAVQVDLDVQADDLMILDGTTLNDGDKAVNTSTTGDLIVCTYYDATGWYCASGSNDGTLWTDGG